MLICYTEWDHEPQSPAVPFEESAHGQQRERTLDHNLYER